MTEIETETETEVPDKFAALFGIRQKHRGRLFSKANVNLMAELWFTSRALFEKLMDVLAENGVKGIRDVRDVVDKRVKVIERKAQAKLAGGIVAGDTSDDGFERDPKTGAIYLSQGNIRHAIEKLGVTLRHNSFAGNPVQEGLEGFKPTLDDPSMNRLWLKVDAEFGFKPTLEFFRIVVSDTCLLNRYHPVLDYLDGLTWDGKPRLDSWLIDYCNVEDSPYARAVGALMLIAAVRRVRNPGFKHDEMLVLEGIEGIDKSTMLRELAVNEDWFSDSIALNVDDKKMIESASGKWIIEISELQGMRKGDVGHIKAQLSRQRDRARLAYGRLPVEVDRQCVFFGTVNPAEATGYLASMTGNRRFWPVEVKSRIDIEAFRRDRDQLWAEASAREALGESTRLDPDLWEAAAGQQEEREAPNPFYDTLLPVLGHREGTIFMDGIWTILEIPIDRRASHYEKVGKAMKDLGWRHVKRSMRPGGRRAGAYEKGTTASAVRRITVERDYMLRHGELLIGYEGAVEEESE
jgi:hypothetical protein